MECEIASYHVDSFNYLIEPGVRLAALDVPPVKFRLQNGENVEMYYTNGVLNKPMIKVGYIPDLLHDNLLFLFYNNVGKS